MGGCCYLTASHINNTGCCLVFGKEHGVGYWLTTVCATPLLHLSALSVRDSNNRLIATTRNDQTKFAVLTAE